MPQYRYLGDGPCRYGSTQLNKGDVIDASALPGKNFVRVDEKKETAPVDERKPSKKREAADTSATITDTPSDPS